MALDDREIELELTQPSDLARSRVLHRVRLLDIYGFRREQGTNLATRDDLTRLFEIWSIRWHPEFDAACIEAARYGVTLADAATARLLERAEAVDRDAEQAALLLLDSALAGGWLADDALVVLEEAKGAAIAQILGLKVDDTRVYGDTQVIFLIRQ